MFFLCRLGPSEHEIADFEYPSFDLPFVVPTEGLLVASGADDGCLAGLFEQVDCILLSFCGLVVVENFYSWCTVVEVGGQHCLSSISQEERHEPYGSIQGHP